MSVGTIAILWLLRNARVKSKLFSLFSFICLQGLSNVVGMGDDSIEGSAL